MPAGTAQPHTHTLVMEREKKDFCLCHKNLVSSIGLFFLSFLFFYCTVSIWTVAPSSLSNTHTHTDWQEKRWLDLPERLFLQSLTANIGPAPLAFWIGCCRCQDTLKFLLFFEFCFGDCEALLSRLSTSKSQKRFLQPYFFVVLFVFVVLFSVRCCLCVCVCSSLDHPQTLCFVSLSLTAAHKKIWMS